MQSGIRIRDARGSIVANHGSRTMGDTRQQRFGGDHKEPDTRIDLFNSRLRALATTLLH
jgi:hypothetical protein